MEVILVIALMAILGVTLSLDFSGYIDRSYDGVRKTDLHKMQVLLESYYDRKGSYPAELPDCGQPLPYLSWVLGNKMPCDPQTKEPYFYQVNGSYPESYKVYINLMNEKDASVERVGCSGGCGPDCAYNYGVSSPNVGLTRCSYVCAPGGGQSGSCELYVNTESSECPVLYGGDITCRGECNDPSNRCKNASGKRNAD
ncbi:MAG: hypothetical protein UW26_C0003G0002 [Candidatus Collierbacteria bacterium GW2011_GWF1_44_12]|uniref:Type II secretion system protein GspG C-terminal domain-containing protein n=1 Tax=Candidatus Collierbacteria bacterium GW2011_GWF1_44_12 TaxID=1618402 RepID=A0A0G1GW78_9BACT|nr:MAG: hypothetical protein UW26_C0003G0002 [Candidatus Collierbacteria bacterium GW2011_GWF1_44_12]